MISSQPLSLSDSQLAGRRAPARELARRLVTGTAIALLGLAFLQGCSTTSGSSGRSGAPVAQAPGNDARPGAPVSPPSSVRRPGGYYQDDGPGSGAPDIDSIPDAVPKPEPLATRANRPYSVFGIQYLPLTQLKPYREKGVASWYGRKFHGQATSNGERYDMYAMSAAHPTLPLPSYVKVTNPRNGKSVIVRVNDRGPFLNNRIIDLSYTAAAKLGYVNQGSTEVEVELIDDPVRWAMNNGSKTAAAKAESAAPALPAATPSVSNTPGPGSTAPAPASGTTASSAQGTPSVPAPATPVVVASAAGSTTGSSPGSSGSGGISSSGGSSSSGGGGSSSSGGNADTGASAAARPPADGPLVLTRETMISTPTGATAPGLYLQLGAFSARDTAEATRQRLARQFPWLTSDSAPKTDYLLRPEAGLFKLHVGPYKTRAEAMTSIDRLRSESGLQAFVVTR